jgi:two-component system chemotaxis sensor kinase CheA
MTYSEEQVRAIFFDEMAELLEAIDRNVILFEKQPGNLDCVRSLFRDVHTLKGSSGVMGYQGISVFAHRVEDLLDRIRHGRVSPDETIFELLFNCFDRIREMMDAAREHIAVESEDDGALLTLLSSGVAGERRTTVQDEDRDGDPASTRERYIEISLANCQNLFAMGIDPRVLLLNCRDLAAREFQVKTHFVSRGDFRSFDAESCQASFVISFWSEKDEAEIRDVFEFVIDSCRFSLSAKTAAGNLSTEGVRADLPALPGATHSGTQAAFPSGPTVSAGPEELEQSEYVRVRKDKLDRVLTLSEEFSRLKGLFEGVVLQAEGSALSDEALSRLRGGVRSLSQHSAELRDFALSARMVPIGTLFSRYARLVRDISKRLGKQVNLVVQGGSTEIDRAVGEAISDPIMHLLRNAVDHGIESPAARLDCGKVAEGTIVMAAGYEGTHLHLVVRDDGRGIDVERVKAKALAMKLVSREALEQMAQREIFELIFHSGFSTAERVTDVSGRGVGMDVVRSNLLKIGGAITIDSHHGKGTEFTLSVPFSMALVDALLVACDERLYAIPQSAVVDVVRTSHLETFDHGGRLSLSYAGEVVPFLDLRAELATSAARFDGARWEAGGAARVAGVTHRGDDAVSLVVLGFDGKRVAFCVDASLGVEQIVVKSLEAGQSAGFLYSGTCFLDQEGWALVLSPGRIVAESDA